MPKRDRKPDPDVEPDYDTADVEYDDAPVADFDAGVDVEYDELADAEYEEGGQADYEDEVADPDYEEVLVVDEPEEVAEPVPAPTPVVAEYAFDLGHSVRLDSQQLTSPVVVWRGVLKERHPATGLVQRVPVYRLDDGHWDCYREEDLQAA